MTDAEYSSTWCDRTARLIGPEPLESLRGSCVLMAGCGGVGGATAVLLARMGIGRFLLTDPGIFDPPDANRQWGADAAALGENKAERYGEILARINPDARIEVVPGGVTGDNLAALVAPADVVVDGLDLAVSLDLRARLFAEARHCGAYCISAPAVGFGTLVAASLPEGMPMDPFVDLLRAVGQRGMPPALGRYFSPSTLDALNRELPRGKVPSIAVGPALCAALSATEVAAAVTHRAGRGWRRPLCLPQALTLDTLAMRYEAVDIGTLLAAFAGGAGP